jgi:hypothetical protein
LIPGCSGVRLLYDKGYRIVETLPITFEHARDWAPSKRYYLNLIAT